MSEQQTSTNQGATQTSAPGQSSAVAETLFGGADPGAASQQGGGNNEGQQAATQQGDAGAGQQAPPLAQQGAAGLTSEQLREIVREATAGAVTAAQPQQQAAPLTQEQVNTMLNHYAVKPDVATQLARALGVEVQPQQAEALAQVLNNILEGKARHILTMSTVQLEALKRNDLAAITQQLTPIQNAMRQQQENELRAEFMSQNQELKGYEPVLEMVYGQMVANGAKFPNKEAAFKAVKEQAQAVLKKLPGGATNGNGQQQTGTPAGGARSAAGQRMSTVSTGGQSGATPGQGNMSTQERQARALFGKSM